MGLGLGINKVGLDFFSFDYENNWDINLNKICLNFDCFHGNNYQCIKMNTKDIPLPRNRIPDFIKGYLPERVYGDLSWIKGHKTLIKHKNNNDRRNRDGLR